LPAAAPRSANVDWPSYNRTLTSERFAPLDSITRANVSQLRVACTYDLGIETSFQTGPIVIGRVMYATTEKEIFAIDAATCAERWRTKEDVADSFLKVNRGAAFLDGRLFRGLQDGRVVAYDAKDGSKIWERESPTRKSARPFPPHPSPGMAWFHRPGWRRQLRVKGRMYALDAASGKQLWETWLVPREEQRIAPTTPTAKVATPTWGNAPKVPIAGGATWTSYTLDPSLGCCTSPAVTLTRLRQEDALRR
jgi:alcohol dehydrogenase (cytochrome c)